MSDLSMKRGDTLKIKLTVRDANGLPQNITGWLFWFTVKRSTVDPDERAVFATRTDDTTNAIEIDNAVGGQITCTMPAIATRLFPDTPTRVVYDVQAKDGVGMVTTIDSGTIRITPDVTRAIS